MNNLLQSLASRRLKLAVPDGDLKRLLGAVKESRGHDSKLSDAFYESLDGIVQDLRTVTIDNRDAEAFLKPVSKIDYPDYYEIISNPMDLQTVHRKVKSKQYKSKKEFADDLDLIWSNCYTYNTGENHHLRQCVNRLREKANKLLKNITDRKDRLDPPVPVELGGVNGASVKMNGVMTNGYSRKHSTPPFARSRLEGPGRSSVRSSRKPSPSPYSPREVSFQDMPAFARTPSGMANFLSLDTDLETAGAGPSTGTSIAEKLERYTRSRTPDEEWQYDEVVNGDVGEKRKMMNGDFRPRKRSRTPRDREGTEPEELWWEAALSQDLMANGLPIFKHPSSFSLEDDIRIPAPPGPINSKNARRKKRKRPPETSSPKSLLGYINNNIRTLKRVRRTHDKFLALNLGSEEGATGLNGQPLIEPPEAPPLGAEHEVDVQVDDRPWRTHGTGMTVVAEEADECMHWIGMKILEHSGFQSTSKSALDVFAGVASDFLLNVGRTIRFLCDNYSHTMSSEEIILHTLFESGIPHVQDLEGYITDDVVRYGSRLSELEKKMVGVYNEVTTVEALDDDAFFAEDEDEEGELLMGNFADSFGDDFLGLRELGIASELGLSNLTIPKRLLKGKNKGLRNAEDDAKPKEPPLPYPLPPPFQPLVSTRVERQIGVLKNFYMRRFNEFAASTAPSMPPPFIRAPAPPPPRPLSPNSSLQLSLEMSLLDLPTPIPQSEQPPPPSSIANPLAPPLLLPDDLPPPSRSKIGPLGQIMRPSASAASKKKSKPKENPSMAGMPGMIPGFAGPAPVVRPPEGAVMMNGGILSINGYPPVTQSGTVSPAPGSQSGATKRPVGSTGGVGGGPNGAAGPSVAGKKNSDAHLRPPFITASA